MNEVVAKEDIKIEDMIYEIRGKQVMLDSDLARLYKCKNGTKEINQAVRNSPEKFPERFSFVLNDSEMDDLRSKNLTSSLNKHGGRRYNIRVFTEQGVAMLATILRTKVATEISIQIMDAFVTMRKYISTSLLEQNYVNNMLLEHEYKIKVLQDSFQKIEEKKRVNEIYFNGQIYDAYSKIQEIFNSANKNLIIIDAYADNTVLDIIKRLNINVTLITKPNNLLTEQDITKYNKQYRNLTVIFDKTFHDRYFILDHEIAYHCGASINRIGYKTFSITLIGDEDVKNTLINKIKKIDKEN